MISKDREAPAPDKEPSSAVAGANVSAARSRPGKKSVGATVGTAVAAATLAAVTVLGGPALAGASAPGPNSASIISSPPNSVASRIAGVHEDMARAVQWGQITSEQAAFLEDQLIRRIKPGAQGAA